MFYFETQSVGIHEVLTLLSFTMHHWAIFKAHLYICFQFYLNSLSEAMYWYVECIAAKQNMPSCISCHLNMVRSKSNCWTRSSREKATTFFVFRYHVRPYDKIGRKISKFGGTMSDHRLLLPALLQDGTLISIHTFKWPTVFIKDRFFSEPGLLLKKKKHWSTPFQDHNFFYGPVTLYPTRSSPQIMNCP